jgi:autotransporter-associated beta strand protein
MFSQFMISSKSLRCAVLLLLGCSATAQTLTLTNGVRTYSTLNSTTVTMTGRCELHVTSGTSPLTGCVINLSSPDAWLFLTGVKPSVVVSTYLGQVRVSGSAAVVDSNCRVVEYAMGAVVIPQAPSFQPLTVFSAPHFTGSSMALSQYVYYKSSLGALYANISSFKLKRGYMAVMAQTENGTGISKCYIAQDGDLEVSLLPSDFDNSVRFVYVTPWRWTSKKGIAGNIEGPLNVQWKYNWNLDQNSTRDLEYVPIRQLRWWPGLSQNWQTRGANTVLGYNEPDKSDQANLAVGDAIYSWPDLLGTGLRVGSPAVSDGGRSGWLYPFISQADAANLRVDFVAVHYYWCASPSSPSAAADQMYNFLKATYDQVKRPLWITEWNQGANWTGCGDPSYAQQQASIAAMIDMLDKTPFVERYAPYNWVEDVRRLEWDDGSLTSAGVTYRDQPSPVGHVQALPNNATRSFTQLSFDSNTLDSSGYGNNGITSGSPAYTNGHAGQAIVFDGSNTVVTLPPNVANNNAFSFAAWINWNGGGNWQRIFDFGNSTTHYLFLTPNTGGAMRFAIANGGGEQRVETGVLPQNQWIHLAVTLSGSTARVYTNGVLAAQNTSLSITPASFSPRVNTLGRSQFVVDPLFKGLMDDVLITDYALSAAQVAALQTNTPPQFTNSIIARPGGTEGVAYASSVAGAATDIDPGDTLVYSKTAGPGWLSVAADGTLSGTPTTADGGVNYFTVRATDAAGQNAFTLVTIPVTVLSGSGVWIADASANWSETNRWSGNQVASGASQTANFSTINITANRAVTLDSSRSIGTLQFGDTVASQSWTIASASNSVLTLDAGAASPSLIVTNTATIAAPLAGVNGFTKSGPGTLILSGNNSLSGTVNIDTGSSTAVSDGITRLVGPGSLGNATLVQIRNNNSGTSTLQLDGSTGSISVDADVSVTCRNSGVVTIENLAGTNIFNGSILLNVGGNSHTIQSDANSLIVFTGTNMYVGSLTGARTYYFTGLGNHLLVGPLLNSTNGAPIALSKSGTGTLTLEAQNTYANGTTLSGGRLIVNGSLPVGAFTVGAGTTLGGNGTIYPSVTLPAGSTLAPGTGIGTLTVSNSVLLQAGSITRIELNKAAGTNLNDQLRVSGSLTYGGTLVVTSLGGTLWAGDAFQIFSASNYLNGFAAMSLPALSGGLQWNFNPSNGLLRVTQPGEAGVVPVAPSALAAAGGDSLVKLTWAQSATADVTTNNIYRSTSGVGGPYALLTTVPAGFTYDDPAVVNGQTYNYVVTAVSTNGESAWSGTAGATPHALASYAADASTLLLFHFDEPAGTSVVTNYGTLSGTPGSRRAYTVDQTSAITTPPLVTSVLGAGAYPGFGLAARLTGANGYLVGWDANDSGAYDGDQSASVLSADGTNLSVFNMGNGGQSAWTMEALICPTNATVAQPRNGEIICTDNSLNSPDPRGFQFRLTTAGKLELNFINGTTGGAAQQLVDVPTDGPHAYAPSNWFHVAATYDGANVSIYWTKVGPALTAANLLTNQPLNIGPTFGAITSPLVIGGENRGANTETFPGLIDEVRLSSVARTATGFFWQPVTVAPVPPIDLEAAGGYAQAYLNWSASSGATSYNVKRVATSGAAFTVLTNVTTTSFTDGNLPGGTTYYYAVSALNSAGESADSMPVSATLLEIPPPTITSAFVSGPDFIFAGGGGIPGTSYDICSTTNLLLPLSNWTRLQTNLTFDLNGEFQVTNAVLSTEPARFYRVVVP